MKLIHFKKDTLEEEGKKVVPAFAIHYSTPIKLLSSSSFSLEQQKGLVRICRWQWWNKRLTQGDSQHV